MSVPESRIEAILSDILGYDVDLENPKSRVEELLVALGALVGNTPQLDNEGLIPISYLPPVAFADCVTVADQTARYALTTDDVQNGDTVYQNDTQVMYFVVDDTKLDQAAGYKALAAGIAAQAVADKNGDDITTTYLKNEEYNAGKTVPSGTSATIDGTTYTVGQGAEVFNAYSTNKAVGGNSHAEGLATASIGYASHAEGTNTRSIGVSSHSEGDSVVATGFNSHAEGQSTKASSACQHVEGKYNVEDSNNKFAHIIGNGSANTRSNAFAIDWNGKIYTNNAATGVDVCTDLQSKIDSTHKLSADLVDDTQSTNKFATAAELTQIETNKTNISSEQAKTTGMTEGGSNYITVGGIRVYVSATAPTGARTGDLWIGG